MVKFLDIQKINQKYNSEILEAIKRVVDSGWYLMGEENASFEDNFSKYIGVKHSINVGNGLDALRIIFRAYIELGVMKEGDEIIVPANTYIATILAISENKLVPVLVEPNIDTYQIDENKIEEAITDKTKGIIIVHLYGQCAYTEKIAMICEMYKLKLIEDNAQAVGCIYNGRKTGSLGDISAQSFYPGKNLGALGDAGCLTTNNTELAEATRSIANYGSNVKYIFEYQGLNSRMDEIQAAILNVKLKYLNEDNERRKSVAKYYLKNINNPNIILPNVSDWNANVCHLFVIRSENRDMLIKYLSENNIQVLIHYPIPPHKQKAYSEWNRKSFPITERIHNEVVSLPISQVITKDDIKKVTNIMNSFLA